MQFLSQLTFVQVVSILAHIVFVCSIIYNFLPPLETVEQKFGPSPRYWLIVTIIGKIGALNLRTAVMEKFYDSYKGASPVSVTVPVMQEGDQVKLSVGPVTDKDKNLDTRPGGE